MRIYSLHFCPGTDISATVPPIGVNFCMMVQLCPRPVFSPFGGDIFRTTGHKRFSDHFRLLRHRFWENRVFAFRSKHTVAVVTHAHVLQNFYTIWVRGVACQKQRLRPKLEGAGLGEHPKIWDPLCISATVEASYFKFGTQLGFGTSLPKNNVLDQNWRGCGPGEHPKKFGTPYVFL